MSRKDQEPSTDHRSIKQTLQKAKQGISQISPHSLPMFGENTQFAPLNNPMISNEILGQSCDEQGLAELEPPNLVESNKSNKSNNYEGYQPIRGPFEEFQSDDEKLQSMIDKYDFVALLCSDRFIACTIKNKSCNLCNGSGFITVEKVKEDLNKRFKAYYRKNYKKLIEYFEDKYKIQINSFEKLMEITQQIVLLDQNQKFIFRCHDCKKFFKNEYTVYLKNQKKYCESCAWVIGFENIQKFEYNEINGIIPAQSPFFPMQKQKSQTDDIDQQFL